MELKLNLGGYKGICVRLLLIVPYGIETISPYGDTEKSLSFNRTLWN